MSAHPDDDRAMLGMWLGLLGGAMRVSQIQLVQPFLSILAAVPLLGEPLETVTLGFALAVVATVFVGKRFAMPPQGTQAEVTQNNRS